MGGRASVHELSPPKLSGQCADDGCGQQPTVCASMGKGERAREGAVSPMARGRTAGAMRHRHRPNWRARSLSHHRPELQQTRGKLHGHGSTNGITSMLTALLTWIAVQVARADIPDPVTSLPGPRRGGGWGEAEATARDRVLHSHAHSLSGSGHVRRPWRLRVPASRGVFRSGQVSFISRPKSRTMRTTRQHAASTPELEVT